MSQDNLLTLNSYSRLSSISLPVQCDLHPQACCPTMDIIALVSKSASEGGSTVNLYRLSGPKAWSVEVKGPVGALGWSLDGLHLAVYLPLPSELSILSVHDGAFVQTVSVPEEVGGGDEPLATLWNEHKIEWEIADVQGKGKGRAKVQPISSVFEMMNLLPLVTPMDKPTPSTTSSFLPFSFPKPAAPSPTSTVLAPNILLPPLPHLLHSTLPSQASLSIAQSPSLLKLSSSLPFLSGTFPLGAISPPPLLSPASLLPSQLSPSLHDYARTLTALQSLLHDAISALSILSLDWFGKDGGGMMTNDWMRSLKEVGARFEGGEVDVREELTRLLITGKGGDAVAHFMGGRLTERTLAKWEGTVLAALTSIRQACYRHITPALERTVLLIEEMHGRSLWKDQYPHQSTPAPYPSLRQSLQLQLEPSDLSRAVDLARHAVHRSCELEQAAREEHRRFEQFSSWLRYELSIATSPDMQTIESNPPPATHDVLLVADYIQSGLLSSSVDLFLRPCTTSQNPQHIVVPLSPLEISRDVDLSRAISHTIAPLQAGRTLADYEETVNPDISTTSTIHKSRNGQPPREYGSRTTSVGNAAGSKGMLSPVLSRRSQTSRRKTRLSQSFGGEDGGENSSMSMSMSMAMDDESRADSSTGSVGIQGQQSHPNLHVAEAGTEGEEAEGCSMMELGDELMRVLRKVTAGALAGEMDSKLALAEGRKRRRVEGVEGRIRDWVVRADDADPQSWIAFVASTDLGSLLYIASASRSLPSTLNGFRCSLQLDFSPGPTAVKLIDMDFFNDEELVLVLGVGDGQGSKVFLASIAYPVLDFTAVQASTSSQTPVDRILQGLEPASHFLPLSRCRHLPSLDRMPLNYPDSAEEPHLPPISLALNGRKGRMSGSLLTWGGREVEVYDFVDDDGLNEDEGDLEDMEE